MLPPMSVVSPRITSGSLKPGGGMNEQVDEAIREKHARFKVP